MINGRVRKAASHSNQRVVDYAASGDTSGGHRGVAVGLPTIRSDSQVAIGDCNYSTVAGLSVRHQHYLRRQGRCTARPGVAVPVIAVDNRARKASAALYVRVSTVNRAGGAFDVVLVWRFDRFARSIEQLVLALAEFLALGIDFVSSQEALDTSTPMGKAMFTIVGAIAELERNVIRERIMAPWSMPGVAVTKSGRQIGRPVVVFDRAQVVKLRAAGRSWRETAAVLAISVRTARRVYAHGVAKPLDWEAENSGAMTRVAGA